MEHPSPRKFVGDAPVYASRRFRRPRTFGKAVLSDFGSALCGDQKRSHDAQPDVYRSPEVMLKVDWSYPVDIWNVGVMVRLVLISASAHQSAIFANRYESDLGFVRRQAYVLRERS